jgi:glycosidase
MLAAMYMLQRGTPFIYQGQEIGMTNIRLKSLDEFQDVMTHNGIRLVQGLLPQTTILKMANKASRENSRTPMQWSREKNAGFTEGTPWFPVNRNYTDINVEVQDKDPDSLLNFYRDLIRYR